MAAANDIDRIERSIDLHAVAEILGISKSWIYRRLKSDTEFPRPKRVGNAVRWRLADILHYRDSLPDWKSQAEEAKAARAERGTEKCKPRYGAKR